MAQKRKIELRYIQDEDLRKVWHREAGVQCPALVLASRSDPVPGSPHTTACPAGTPLDIRKRS